MASEQAKRGASLQDGEKRKSPIDYVAAEFVAMLEKDTPVWRRPYLLKGFVNGVSGRPYQGINRLILALRLAKMGGSEDVRWFPRGQIFKAQERGESWRIGKNEKASWVIFGKYVESGKRAAGMAEEPTNVASPPNLAQSIIAEAVRRKEENDAGVAEHGGTDATPEGKERPAKRYYLLRGHKVWHASQLTGIPQAPVVELMRPDVREAIKVLDEVLKEAGVRRQVEPTVVPGYLWREDYMRMPPPESFQNEEDYLAVFAHELVHAVGKDTRANRRCQVDYVTTSREPASEERNARLDVLRAEEELAAEIGSATLLTILGYPNRIEAHPESHAAYVKAWAQLLTDNPRAIAVAAARAEQALVYCCRLSRELAVMARANGYLTDRQFAAITAPGVEDLVGELDDEELDFEAVLTEMDAALAAGASEERVVSAAVHDERAVDAGFAALLGGAEPAAVASEGAPTITEVSADAFEVVI